MAKRPKRSVAHRLTREGGRFSTMVHRKHCQGGVGSSKTYVIPPDVPPLCTYVPPDIYQYMSRMFLHLGKYFVEMLFPWVNYAVRWLRLPLRFVVCYFGSLTFLCPLIALVLHLWFVCLSFLLGSRPTGRKVRHRMRALKVVPHRTGFSRLEYMAFCMNGFLYLFQPCVPDVKWIKALY